MEINLNKHTKYFIDTISHINYEQNGMFNSEIYPVYVLYKELNCDLFIESGIDNGSSTLKLVELIHDEYIGIDINEKCVGHTIDKKNFNFICDDASRYIPSIINEKSNHNIGVIIDGPKGRLAVSLKNELLTFSNVKFVGIHDTYDGLDDESYLRVFETRTNKLYNEKYFEMLNKTAANKTIYNLLDNYVVNKTYYNKYPTGPGIAIYSKLDLNILI